MGVNFSFLPRGFREISLTGENVGFALDFKPPPHIFREISWIGETARGSSLFFFIFQNLQTGGECHPQALQEVVTLMAC